MRDCMAEMQAAGIADAVQTAVFNKPVMAIVWECRRCLSASEENDGVDCLGYWAVMSNALMIIG